MTFYEDSRSYKAWFEYAEPGLLTNRTIRNFLTGYRAESWPDVVKLTLLYGMVTLRKHQTGDVIPLEEIRQRVRQLETGQCLEEELPPIQEKMKDLKGDVQEIIEAFDPPLQRLSTNTHPTKSPLQTQQPIPNPPHQIEKSTTVGLLQNIDVIEVADRQGIYPEWWGDGSVEEKATQRHPMKKISVPERPPPRLCYSIPPKVQKHVDEDDIVEPKYYLHHFNIPQAAPEPKGAKQESEQPSVSNIAESFLTNPWTSTLCEKPQDMHDHECQTMDNIPRLHKTLEFESSMSQMTMHPNIPRPTSTSFWIDLKQEPEHNTISTPKKQATIFFVRLKDPCLDFVQI